MADLIRLMLHGKNSPWRVAYRERTAQIEEHASQLRAENAEHPTAIA